MKWSKGETKSRARMLKGETPCGVSVRIVPRQVGKSQGEASIFAVNSAGYYEKIGSAEDVPAARALVESVI